MSQKNWRNPTVPGCQFLYYIGAMPEVWMFNEGCTARSGTIEFQYLMDDESLLWIQYGLITR